MKRRVERQRTSLYRSRTGLIVGVCKGVAQYFDFSVFWMRALAVVLLIFSGIWPMLIVYIGAVLLMKPEPVLPLETEEEQDFYNAYTTSRSMALRRLKRIFDHLDRRIQRMESTVTAREYDWECRFNAYDSGR
jgi:phage shock protein C